MLKFLSIIVAISLFPISLEATNKPRQVAHASVYTCEYKSPSVSDPIIGIGASQSQAFIDAADKCFEYHQKKYQQENGIAASDEQSRGHIDICANLTCS